MADFKHAAEPPGCGSVSAKVARDRVDRSGEREREYEDLTA
jgi:hypothetical protein